MVVVLSPIVQAAGSLDDNQALADKEPIMASLNLKAMPFDDVATVLQREMLAHMTEGKNDTTTVSQPNRILSVSKLEEISAVLPMITELGKWYNDESKGVPVTLCVCDGCYTLRFRVPHLPLKRTCSP